jgi:hypothetical protein
MSQRFDSMITKFLRLIPMSAAPKYGLWVDANGGINFTWNSVLVWRTQAPGGGGAVPPQGGIVEIGQIVGANMNVTTDQAIALTLPPGFTRWRLEAIYVNNASISLTTAAGGIYTAAAKAGTAVVAATQVYTTLTAPGDNAAGSALALTLYANAATTEFNATQTSAGLFFSLTTAQGAAATADIYVYARVFR